jgi:DNA-directed RNA polymerase sigma subunit (sigma70/sigma32)
MTDDDRLLDALHALRTALDENVRRAAEMSAGIEEIRAQRAAGRSYSEIVSDAGPRVVVELLTESAHALASAGAAVRRMQAEALYREGMTMDEIARVFGVTRQRVSALLRHR